MPRKPVYDRELAAKVLNLRRAGVPFDVIATQFDLTPRATKALFDKALGSHDPEFERALEGDRLDRLHAAVWAKAVQGEPDAIDRVLRISERREKVAVVPKRNNHTFLKAFDSSVSEATEVLPVDAALVEAGRKIANQVDEAVASGGGVEVTKALYLVPHMMNVLREMLATPASRKAAESATAAEPAKDGRLAQLRAIQGNKRTG